MTKKKIEQHPFRLLYSRRETAERLGLSISSVDVLIARGMLVARRVGRKRLIPDSAITSFAGKNVVRIWPEKVNGKTARPVPCATKENRKTA